MKKLPLLAAVGLALGPAASAEASAAPDTLAVSVFRDIVAAQQGNIVFSPASLESVLRILQQGAAGETLRAFQALPMGRPGVASAMQVESADAVFAADDMRLKPLAVQEVQRVSFTLPEQAADTINAWCNAKTHGLIPTLVTPDAFDANTRLVATNAVHLKERWLHPFNPNSTDLFGQFHTADGKTVQTAMMGQTDKLHYAEGDDWQAVALPYDTAGRPGEPGCFIGILPKGDARRFADTLTAEKLGTIRRALAGAYPCRTCVQLPRMEVRTASFSLKGALVNNGLSIAFSRQADFTGFADEPLYLSEVLQSCYLKVDEEETQAAAATAGIVTLKSASITENYIIFDRPFIWVIGDLNTDAAPYFIGLFEKP